MGSAGGTRNNTSVPYVSYLVPLLCLTKLCAGICAMYQIQLVIEARACSKHIAGRDCCIIPQLKIVARFPLF